MNDNYKITCFDEGIYDSNCYLVQKIGHDECVLIDAGTIHTKIIEKIELLGLKLKLIILTHNHFDHLCHLNKIKDLTGVKSAAHKNAVEGFSDPFINLSIFSGQEMQFSEPEIILSDGDKIEIGPFNFEILHTPGHSSGCISIKCEDIVFTGDSLFKNSIGRTDLPTSNPQELINSIKTKLLTLPDETYIFPGHGPSSTIGEEKANNYFLK